MLTITRDFPDTVKKHDVYKGFEYIITHSFLMPPDHWIYCWYIKLSEKHKLNPYPYNDIKMFPFSPTFKEKDDETDNYWLGFDCWTVAFLAKRKVWSVEYFDFYAKSTIESLVAKEFIVKKR